ncbi:response regulator [Maribacter litopenaei]|uniref:response regulator n=1 Tax=Maribacter litopenaei TaxID=2976127 RepID=UPI003083F41A
MEVLLADDDDLLASLLSFRLKKGGYNVHHSSNGKEVKEYLKTTQPDIIVSDIMMPYFSRNRID